MKLIKLSLFVALMVLFAAACNQPAEQSLNSGPKATPASAVATPDEFAAARATFAKECVNCHKEKGDGGPVTVDGHKLKVPSLREGHALDHPDSDFVEQINKGGDGMPAFKDKLKPDEINGLVRFIRHEFQGGRTPPPEPVKPAKH
jgi:mono/diheme cytochrome c family protein